MHHVGVILNHFQVPEMLKSFFRLRARKPRIFQANLGVVLSISCAAISIAFIGVGYYHLAAIVAGANLIATRWAIRNSKKAPPTLDGKIFGS
jgi:hypothetical protein